MGLYRGGVAVMAWQDKWTPDQKNAVDALVVTFSEAFRSTMETLLDVEFTPDEAASLIAQSVMRRAWLIARMAALSAGRVPNKRLFVEMADSVAEPPIEWRFVDHFPSTLEGPTP